MSKISTSLAKAFSDPLSHGAIQFAPTVEISSSILRDRDLILIGGPKTNHITEEVLRLCDLTVDFRTRESNESTPSRVDVIRYVDSDSGKEKELLTKGDEVFAFLAQVANPFSNQSRHTITILAGSSTYGTELAALAFADPSNLRKFAPLFRKRRGFVAIAKGELGGRNDTDRWVGSQKIIFVDTFDLKKANSEQKIV